MTEAEREARELIKTIRELAYKLVNHPGLLDVLGWPKEPVHEQGIARVGAQEAAIDRPLIPLIQSLWEQGCETVTSCQDAGGQNQGEVEAAYVGFVARDRGADRFKLALDNAGIANELRSNELRVPLSPDPSFCDLVFYPASVTFHPEAIARAIETVSKGLPS